MSCGGSGIQVDYDANEQAVVDHRDPRRRQAGPSASATSRSCTRPSAFAESQGLDWDDLSIDKKLDIVEEASAEGRLGKMKSDEKRIWREQAASLGWQHQTVMEDATHERLTDEERFDRAYAFAARQLAKEFHTAAVIDHEKLGMYAAQGSDRYRHRRRTATTSSASSNCSRSGASG